MSYESLKNLVSSAITSNGNNENTGERVRNLINDNLIEELGNSTFSGLATPSTNPNVSDKPIFYFANEQGTYTDFENIDITQDGLYILSWNTIFWEKIDLLIVNNPEIKIGNFFFDTEGNTNSSEIENGNTFRGWDGNIYYVGKVTSTPFDINDEATYNWSVKSGV